MKKNTVEVDTVDPDTKELVQEKTGVFSISTLSEISKSKLKLKAAENEIYVRSKMPLIKSMFDAAGDDKLTLNSVVVKLLGQGSWKNNLRYLREVFPCIFIFT